MADEKKRDEFAINMGEPSNRHSPGPSRPLMSPGSSSAPKSSFVDSSNQGLVSVLSYCVSSILMTTTNKYVLSGLDYNLNFLLLAVQVRKTTRLRTNANENSLSLVW